MSLLFEMRWLRFSAISHTFCPLEGEVIPKTAIDVMDARIIAALQLDGRLSNAQLADMVGLSPSPCLRRVQRLEREGYIEGY